MSLQRKENNLRRAQTRFDRVNRRTKQFQIEFRREANSHGTFHTRAHIVRDYKEYHGNDRGLLHKAVNLKYRIKGDRPSVTRTLSSWKPETAQGKILRNALRAGNFAVHDVAQTAADTALAGETIALKTGDAAARELRNKLRQKYTREAVDDYHRGVFFMGRTAADAVKGTRHHLRTKKQHKLEKAKYQLKKADNSLFREKTYEPKLIANAEALRSSHADYRSGIVTDRNNRYRRALNKRRLQTYRQEKRELKFERNKLKKENRFRTKELKNQKKIMRNSAPGLMALKPVSYSAGRMKASAWQKAVNEDEENDFIHAADSAKRRIAEPVKDKASKPKRLHQKEKKRDRLSDKKAKSNKKLKRQESRLNAKHDSFKKRNRRPKRKSLRETVSSFFLAAYKYIKNLYEEEVKKFFLTMVLPVLIIFLVFAFIIMLFTSVFSNGGFTLGTYAAQDYDLSEAEKYYTKLAYELNKKILKVSSESEWKSGLVDFGANRRDLKDKPDTWVWGRSSVYNWDPVYDFDCWKLWAFLCSYYYNFDADNDDIYYWEFTGDTEDLLDEIFDAEYEFVYWYDNQSRWEELSPYNYFGGGNASSGSYYVADKNAYICDGEPYRYRFKPNSITSELAQFEDSDGYICIRDDYRVLNPNDEYKETGFYVMDHRWYSGTSEPFYYYDGSADQFYFNHGGDRHNRNFWGWDGTDAWFLVSPGDTQIWNSSLGDVCLYGYYEKYRWKTECSLYYNVKQKKSFDDVIADKLGSMSHSDERLQYYTLLVGGDSGTGSLYGNHQTLHNLLPWPTVRAYDLKRQFGYEMTEWNTDSEGLYQGIKVYAAGGTALKAPFKCKIKDVDTRNNKITLRKDDVEYWYDGTGGTKRDTEVEITNAVLKSGFRKGDTINDGQEFAETTSGNVNFHVNIDTDGYGWDYIDPRLVLY